uniref:Mediator of RNA polymerase II transcription subunit 10 n=1 Tax=Pyramimonas obovata TaxID=1411642 RepID=A0A7S0RVT4_9CHLO|mmetsp:Transcript_65/g.147  ORF Transcript_65/g.147 Transcript_65/m.147 type:complete len:154 (+) Transcript_65:259-720(+)
MSQNDTNATNNSSDKHTLEDHIVKSLWQGHELEQQVQDFSEDSQQLLFERMNNFVDSLTHLRESASSTTIEVPVELLAVVDRGENPDLFSVSRFEQCIERNQATKGRVTVLKEFSDSLLDAAKEAFPSEAEQYVALRKSAEETAQVEPSQPAS